MKKATNFLLCFLTLFFISVGYSSWLLDYKFATNIDFGLKEAGGKIDSYLDDATAPYASFISLESAVNDAKNYTDKGKTVNMYLTAGSFIEIENKSIVLYSGMNLYMPYEGKSCDISNENEIGGLGAKFIDTNENNVKKYNVSKFSFYNSTLTINSGASLTIGGKFQECGVSGLYSQIDLDPKSFIEVSGSLICNGYVKEISAKESKSNKNNLIKKSVDNADDASRYIEVLSGGILTVPMAFYDAPGMSALEKLNDNGVFPINTFDFPNVQTYFKINAGSTFKSICRMFRKSSSISVPINEGVTVVKPSNSSENALMSLSSGYVSFEYCPLNPGFTNQDASKTNIIINGTVSLGFLSFKIDPGVGSAIPISTEDKFLPFSYKFNIYIKENGVFNSNSYKIKFLPGSFLKILESGTFNLSGQLVAYEDGSLSSLYEKYNGNGDAEIIVNGTFKANSGSKVGAHFKTTSSNTNALLNFTDISQDSLSISSPEGNSATKITVYSTGEFIDEDTNEPTTFIVKAGVNINSLGNDTYCWNGIGCFISYKLSIKVDNNKNYQYPLAGYQVYKYDSNGSEALLTTEGAYETTSKDFILVKGESFKVISLDRAEKTEFTEQNKTSYTFTSGTTYEIKSNMTISIYPGEGILVRFSVSSGSGAGGASHKIYEKTSGSYNQIAAFDGPTASKDVPIKKGATIKYWIKLGTQDFFNYSTDDFYKFDGIVSKTSALSTDDMSGGTKYTKKSESSGYYAEVTNVQASCTVHLLIVKKSGGGCFAKGTPILCADGTYKPIESIRVGDSILTWSHESGKIESQAVTFIPYHSKDIYEVLELTFDNGHSIKVLYAHGFMNCLTKEYEEISLKNVKEKIGTPYLFVSNDGELYESKLSSYKSYLEETECYSISSAYNLNHIINGALSISDDIQGLYNYFELDSNYRYDIEKKERDIAKYGLLSYGEVSSFMSYEIYDLFNVKYLSVSIGKQLITMDKMKEYINKYAN